MSPEAWGVLGAAWAVAQLVAAYVGFYAVVWAIFAACMAWDRQLHAPPVVLTPDQLPPTLRALYPEGYTIPGGLAKPALYVGKAWLFLGYLGDLLGNIGLTVLFLELPGEYTMTARITRWVERMPDGRRRRLALWMRVTWLDGLDRHGIHRA